MRFIVFCCMTLYQLWIKGCLKVWNKHFKCISDLRCYPHCRISSNWKEPIYEDDLTLILYHNWCLSQQRPAWETDQILEDSFISLKLILALLKFVPTIYHIYSINQYNNKQVKQSIHYQMITWNNHKQAHHSKTNKHLKQTHIGIERHLLMGNDRGMKWCS